MSISTCALREEGDPAIIKITASHSGFLSTPSARRATDRQKHSSRTFTISIHALREEGDVPRAAAGRQSGISIHALREEGDLHPAPCRGLR